MARGTASYPLTGEGSCTRSRRHSASPERAPPTAHLPGLLCMPPNLLEALFIPGSPAACARVDLGPLPFLVQHFEPGAPPPLSPTHQHPPTCTQPSERGAALVPVGQRGQPGAARRPSGRAGLEAGGEQAARALNVARNGFACCAAPTLPSSTLKPPLHSAASAYVPLRPHCLRPATMWRCAPSAPAAAAAAASR